MEGKFEDNLSDNQNPSIEAETIQWLNENRQKDKQ